MESSSRFQSLSPEIIREILSFVDADSKPFVPVYRRAHLSTESFQKPAFRESATSPAKDIATFRLVCKQFSSLAIPHQFTRVTIRFTEEDFKKLDNISASPHLAEHVKKFTYMVPYFCVEGRDRILELLRSTHWTSSDIQFLEASVNARQRIVRERQDMESLRQAIKAFTSLQHIKILRLQGNVDGRLLNFARRRNGTRLVDMRWTPACAHALQTMVDALKDANSPFSRFSCPHMDPESILELRGSSSPSLTLIGSHLTCVELHFLPVDDSDSDGRALSSRMRSWAGLFRAVLKAAPKLEAIHVGFPQAVPLELGLEEIFHDLKWDNLRAFGVQAWRLDAREIVNIARRHRKTLRGLRLRDVKLKEGGMWKDVLRMLRDEMEVLEWVSLTRIDYASAFDSKTASFGNEVVDDDFDSSEEASHEDVVDDEHTNEEIIEEVDEISDEDDGGSTDGHSHFDDGQDHENGPQANQLTLSPDTPATAQWSFASGEGPLTADELGDNGSDVIYEQRRFWEQWVIARPGH